MPTLAGGYQPSAPLARGRLYAPRTLSLHLTDLSNEACVFCAADTAAGRQETVTPTELRAILDAHPAADWPAVNIHGGEPTLRPDFLQLLAEIRQRGHRRVILQTNALRMANPGFAAEVHRIGVDVFVCGFHAADPVTAARITRNPKSFALALRGFEQIKRGGARLRVTTVMCAENLTVLPDVAWLCAERGVDHLNLSALQPQDFATASLVSYDACPGFEALHVDWRTQNLKVTFHQLTIDDFDTFLTATTRVRTEACAECLVRGECGGVYRDYLAAYGDGAFEPYGQPEDQPYDQEVA